MIIKFYSKDESLLKKLEKCKPTQNSDHILVDCVKFDEPLSIAQEHFKKNGFEIRLIYTDTQLMRVYPVKFMNV